MNEDWKKGSVAVLIEIKKALDGCRWFIEGGTLLGAVRDGALIPWRSCLGIGVLGDPSPVHARLEKIGFKIDTRSVPVVATRHDAYVDVLSFPESGGGYIFTFRHYLARLPKRFFECTDTAYLDGVPFPAPCHMEEYLDANYGDWKTPVKYHAHHPSAFQPFNRYIFRVIKPGSSISSFQAKHLPVGCWHG